MAPAQGSILQLLTIGSSHSKPASMVQGIFSHFSPNIRLQAMKRTLCFNSDAPSGEEFRQPKGVRSAVRNWALASAREPACRVWSP